MKLFKNGSITATKEELIKAFELWTKEYEENPDDFYQGNPSGTIGEDSYGALIEYLNKTKQHGK
tara:strand:+ start:2016 stop:2207 length:192 start_codon:yes stop_codon:yes gene_type:complete